jgi:putative ABC transport system permease protein
MAFLKQTLALTLTGLRGLSERRGSSLVTVIGVTSVVGVLASLLSMREGATVMDGDRSSVDNVVVQSRGATSVVESVLGRDVVTAIADAPGVRRAPDGEPYVAAAAFVSVDAIRRNGKRGGVSLVGVTSGAALVEPGIRLLEGRSYRPALHELIVSDPIRRIFRGMEVGSRITLRGVEWQVVGVFTGGDSLGDSVLRADAETVLSAFGRNTFQQVNVRLESPAAYRTFSDALSRNPAIAVDVKTLADSRSAAFGDLERLLNFVAWFIGGVMAAGAVCGALNSLYASVDARRQEIATLRAIGFSNTPIVLSLLIEGMLLALPGALAGALIAWMLFEGDVVNTQGRVFTLTITPRVLADCVMWALAIGLLGGSLPALRAARMPVATALRAS